MVLRITALLLLLTGPLGAIDFTPIVPADDSPAMRRFPRLLFKDGARTVSYVRPAGWQFSGAKTYLRLDVNDATHSFATIQEIPRQAPQPSPSAEALTAALIGALPKDNTNVKVASVEKNPLRIHGCETLEIVVAYSALGLDRVESVLFVNLPASQVQFCLNALSRDFKTAHELFRRSYFSWQWLD
ncbi:MAG: hypothetical protein QOE70_3114 [Chthoniobacter sp.]|jgi:hypothetical protein|nr:hypothetical protein [Chthoniobacter sp.]